MIRGFNMKIKSVFKILIALTLILLAISIVSSNDLSDSNVSTDLSDDSGPINSDDSGPINSDDSNPVDSNLDDASNNAKVKEDKLSDSQSDSSLNDNDDSSDDKNSTGDSDKCNLAITKTGDEKVNVGDTVEWKIEVKNSLNTAENISVDEILPDNFELESAKASQGQFAVEIKNWDLGNLKENQSANLIIKAKALKAGNYTNEAVLSTDSDNINGKKISAKAKVEVVSKNNVTPVKPTDKKDDSKAKKIHKIIKNSTNNTKNNTNKTISPIDLKKSGNPLMAVIISSLAVLGIFLGKRRIS